MGQLNKLLYLKPATPEISVKSRILGYEGPYHKLLERALFVTGYISRCSGRLPKAPPETATQAK
jgi:hypothetical protein